MVTDCLKHGVRTFLVESGDRLAKGRVVQEMGDQGLAEPPLEVTCFDYAPQYTNPRSGGPLARQMLGAGHELVARKAGEVEPRPAEGTGFRGRLARGQVLA